MTDIESRYHSSLLEYGFREAASNEGYNSIGRLYSVPKNLGQGVYWVYGQKDLYDIKIHDFFFYEDSFIQFEIPDGCLGICYYDSISGEEISPYRHLTAGCVKSFIGGSKACKTLVHKNIPIRSIDIEITPAYYDKHLKEKFPSEYIDPHEAFGNIELTDQFPEMIRLFRQLWDYRGDGIAAKLFYDGKVTEAISLIMKYSERMKQQPTIKLSTDDIHALENAASYINDHFNCNISVEQLSHIACMGRTKLKLAFKEIYGCPVTEYIQQRRLSHAETLLASTDFTIEQIATAIGYRNGGRFAGMFKRSTGLFPAEYRKMAQRK
ncbi:MAG: AraC family transcriptional regulator [Lachnospiraceae bacterium]|nr:AraC family transcriptional regulator [Lachnospiraceae bacterium]